MTHHVFIRQIGVEHPIIQAPMAGGTTTPELVAAVANAGGIGSLGAAYLTPEQLLESVAKVRLLTNKPFNVNLFAGGYATENTVDPGPMLALMTEIHETLGLPAPTVPAISPSPFREQFQTVLEARPAIFSFTFGIPSADDTHALKTKGIFVLGTATTPQEAALLTEAGVDGIVAQGAEAGAHRGTFAVPFEQAMVPTMELVSQIAALTKLPVIASGGLMDGRDITAALARGASGAQLGTAFLPCPESGTPVAHKEALLAAKQDTTVVTRAFSGRPARGLMNAYLTRMESEQDIVLPFPLQNRLTRPMRTAAAKLGDAGYLALWAGQGVARSRSLSAADLLKQLVEEMNANNSQRLGFLGGPMSVPDDFDKMGRT